MQSSHYHLSVLLALLAGLVLATARPALAASPDDPGGRELLQDAQRLIAAYHEGQPHTNHVLRVVYFVPKDYDPLPNYAERLDRIMNDISDFYRGELLRFGIKSGGLPLERKDGKLVLHLVRSEFPGREYHYNSGDRTVQEIRRALQGTMDLDREYVLVFYALCRKEADERYVFDAPYYGDANSSQRNGLCHVADCELLDPLLLTATNRPMVFTEHYYPRFKTTVARFNTMYLGGVAHELGHGLGLPHNGGSEAERDRGISLMGGGNLNYREELWGGGPPVYLGRASALQLVSHPLFTGSDRGRWDEARSEFKSLEFSTTNGNLTIKGVVTGAIPPYAVIAYTWPASGQHADDHGARSFPCALKDGGFTLNLGTLPSDAPRQWHLLLERLHVNGAAKWDEIKLNCDASGMPDVAALNAQHSATHN